MLLNAKNEVVKLGNTEMDYISFGKGSRNLIMLPGLGDGLLTVKGTALPFAIGYRAYAKNYKVHVFSRKNQMDDGYSTREMAKDQAEAMNLLGISQADIIGISQGGMIAQYLAIDYPDLVNKLVLTVTLSKQNETIHKVVNDWIGLAEQGDYKSLITDTAEKSYSEKYLKRHRFLYPFLSKVGKPKDFNRFLIQANSCIQHNAYNELDRIKCPTLVVGGDCDKIVGLNSSEEIAERINNSQLIIYKGLGHATYEEAKDFNVKVLAFLHSDRKDIKH
jgi:pimeloyl-ACP methyl ester carboxylesterase